MMERITRSGAASPPAPPLAAVLVDVLLRVHRQDDLAAVLDETSAGLVRAGVPCYLLCLLHDPSIRAWHLTTCHNPNARPVLLEQLGVPSGPIPFTPPAQPAPRPLAWILGESWGPELCARLEQRLGMTSAVAVPIGRSPAQALGALIALLPTPERAPMVAGVLSHAATAAERTMHQAGGVASDGILDSAAFARRAENEIARAQRYHRDTAIVLFQFDAVSVLGRTGPVIQRALRRWDFAGRLDVQRPTLAVLLPETGRFGARGFVRRLSRSLPDLPAGFAGFPADGTTFDRLVDVAIGQAVIAATHADEALPPDATVWTRGPKPGRDHEEVECPRCKERYHLPRRPGADGRTRKAAVAAARDALSLQCPRHASELVLPG